MDKNTAEILNITLEEAAEVVQAISKVFRFGFEGCHPDNPGYTNKQHLEEEIGDLICMISILGDQGLLDAESIAKASLKKEEKLRRWSNIYSDSVL